MLIVRPFGFDAADLWLFDRLACWTTPPDSTTSAVAIVEIDDRTLANFGRWPWPRDRLATLVEAITAAQPAAVALTIMFPEPGGDEADGQLARALSTGTVLAGYYFDFAPPGALTPPQSTCLLHPVPKVLASTNADRSSPWFHNAPSAICNVPVIANALAGSGFLNVSPDPDGVLRRIPLFISHGGNLYPSLALAAFLTANPAHNLALRRQPEGISHLRLNDAVFQLDRRGALLPRFRRHAAFPRISAADILSGHLPRDVLKIKGKMVFVGLTAKGAADTRVTAVNPSYAGIDIHASVADTLLRASALSPPGAARFWELLLLLAASSLAASIFMFLPRVYAELAILATSLVVAFVTLLVFSSQAGTFVSPLPSLVAISGIAIVEFVVRGNSQRRRIARAALEVKASNDFILAALTSLTALHDAETGEHIVRVQKCLRTLCNTLKTLPRFRSFLTPETIDLLVTAAPIHDIGKVAIPDAVLKKGGSLTVEERAAIKKHVLYGRHVLESAREQSGLDNPALFDMCCALVSSHHERWDGSGYPSGLKGDAIPIPARILAVIDVYDAIVSRRVYKPALPHDTAIAELLDGRGALFDHEIVDAFLAHQDLYQDAMERNCPESHSRLAKGSGAP